MIYTIWDHDEDGPENMQATTNPYAVETCFRAWVAATNSQSATPRGMSNPQIVENLEVLREIMARPERDRLGRHKLDRTNGWGGAHLTVVENTNPVVVT